jgi:hypothetical protein
VFRFIGETMRFCLLTANPAKSNESATKLQILSCVFRKTSICRLRHQGTYPEESGKHRWPDHHLLYRVRISNAFINGKKKDYSFPLINPV